MQQGARLEGVGRGGPSGHGIPVDGCCVCVLPHLVVAGVVDDPAMGEDGERRGQVHETLCGDPLNAPCVHRPMQLTCM